MEISGNVVIERGDNSSTNKALSIVCPRCGAHKKQYCDKERSMIHAERVVTLFAKESKDLTGPFDI